MRLKLMLTAVSLGLCGCTPNMYVSDDCERIPISPQQTCKMYIEGANYVCVDVPKGQCGGVVMDIALLDGGAMPNFLAVVSGRECYRTFSAATLDLKSCQVYRGKQK